MHTFLILREYIVQRMVHAVVLHLESTAKQRKQEMRPSEEMTGADPPT